MPYSLLPNNVLTHHMLVIAGACPEQRQMFVELFGYRVKVCSDSLRKAHHNGLWITWFGDHFCIDRELWKNDLKEWCATKFSTNEELHQMWEDMIVLLLKHCTK